MNTQQLPSMLESALHKLKQVSEKYSSKSALGAFLWQHEPLKPFNRASWWGHACFLPLTVTHTCSLEFSCLFLSCRLPPRQSAGQAAGGGRHCGFDGGGGSKEHHGTRPVCLGVLQRLSELAAGVAGAELHPAEPWTQSRGIRNTPGTTSMTPNRHWSYLLGDSGVFG